MPKKRLDYLDRAKGVGIFLVVLGHITYIQEDTLRWLSSFHMPLFFVIGGILIYLRSAGSGRVPLRQTLGRRARGVLLPYASFSLMLLAMNTAGFLWNAESISRAELLRQYVDAVTGYGVHILWFLPAYYVGVALFLAADACFAQGKRPLRDLGVLAAAVLAFLLAKGLGLEQYSAMELSLAQYAGYDLLITLLRGVLASPFVLAGWYLGVLLGKSGASSGARLRFLGAGALLLALGSGLALRASVFDLHYLYVQPIHYLNALLSCTGLLLMLHALPEWRPLSWLGRNSLVIMCTHAAFFVIYYVSLGMFFVKKWVPMSDSVFSLGVAVLVCVAELPIVWIFNHCFGYLLGRSK